MAFENISMNLTLNTLAEINLSSIDKDIDLLKVDTKDGHTFLTTTKQSSLSYLGKKWAWLGFGNTSLKQVSRFLNSAEGRKQLEELETRGDAQLAQAVIDTIKALNEKIEDIEKPRRELLQPTFIRVINVRLYQLIRYFMYESIQLPLIDHLEKISLRIEKAILAAQLQEQTEELQDDFDVQLEKFENLLEEKKNGNRNAQEHQQANPSIVNPQITKKLSGDDQTEISMVDTEKELILLKQQLSQLEQQRQIDHSECQAKEKEIASARQQLLEIQNQCMMLEKQRKKLVQQNAIAAAKKQKVQKELKASQLKSKSVELQLENSQITLANLEGDKQKAEKNWQNWYEIAQDKDRVLKEKQADCDEHETKLDQLRKEFAAEQKKLVGEKLSELKVKQEKELKEQEERLIALQQQKAHAEKQWKVCYDTVDKIRGDLVNLQQEYLAEQQKNEQLLQKQKAMLQHLSDLQNQFKSMLAKEQEFIQEREKLLQEKKSLADQLAHTQLQVETLTQIHLDDPLRELISRQLNLPKGTDLNQIVKSTRNILETAIVEALKDGKGQLKLADFQQLEDLGNIAREQANIAAIQDFFLNLEKDQSIAPDVKQGLKDEWNKRDGGIFGKEVKNNQEFFSSTKQEAILTRAKEWSKTKADLQQSIEQFQKQLNADIALGKFIPVATLQVRQRYGNYFALSKQLQTVMPEEAHDQLEMELQKEFQKISNAALIHREIQRKGKEKKVGSFVEDVVLEQLGYTDIKTDELQAKRKQGELDVLKILLQGKGLEEVPIENLQTLLKKEERKGRLETVLNQKDKAKLKQVQHLIETLECEYLAMCKSNESKSKSSIDREIDEHLPEQAKAYFLRSKAHIVDSVNKLALERELIKQKHAIRRILDKTPRYIEDSIHLLIAEIGGQMYTGELYDYAVEKVLGTRIAFYKNWMDNLVSMVQGNGDSNQILGQGTCFAISTQLGLKEQAGDFDPVSLGGKGEDYASEVGNVKALHRFRQALLGVSWQQADKPQSDATSALFGPTVGKALKIKGATTAFILRNPNLASGDFENALKAHAADLEPARGLGIITFWMKDGGSHAIYVRYDKANKIYRLFDPNVGGITFKSEAQLFFCFNDLLKTFYGDLTKLYCHRMDK